MKYDFDKIVDRHGTDCYKWDMIAKMKITGGYVTTLGGRYGF